MTPKVSVLMPAYNRAAYVERSIRSILSQTMADLELVVVDDGSTDGTADIVEGILDPRLRVFRRPHAGCVPAVAFAARQAQGAFLTRQDADDLSPPERIRMQTAFLEAHPAYGLVGGDYTIIDGEDREVLTVRTILEDPRIRRVFLVQLPFLGAPVMVRREAATLAGGYVDERLTAFEDPDLCYRVAMRFPVANLPEVTYLCRRGSENISAKGWHKEAVGKEWEALRRRHAAAGSLELPGAGNAGVVDSGPDPHAAEREAQYRRLLYEAGFLSLGYGAARRGREMMREAIGMGGSTASQRFWRGLSALSPGLAYGLRRAIDARRHRPDY